MSLRSGSSRERPRAVLLLLLQIGLSSVAGYVVLMQTLSVTGCADDSCSRTVWITYVGMLALLVLLLLASTTIIVVRGLRQQPSWWAPTASIVILSVATVVAAAVMRTAVAV
jgi:hypothetical protein